MHAGVVTGTPADEHAVATASKSSMLPPSTVLQRRKLDLKAKFESGSSCSGFKR